MKIKHDNLWLCSDCTYVACNGNDTELVNELATLRGLEALGPHLVPNFDSETQDGINEFSGKNCDSCESYLAGYRARFSVLEAD